MKYWRVEREEYVTQVVHVQAETKDLAKYPTGGRPKRPIESRPADWRSFALQASELTYEPNVVNEALIDNWKPIAWVVFDSFPNVFRPGRRSEKVAQEEMLDVIRSSGLPIVDLDRNPISIEALESLL